ncbi:hypothetical protein QS257_21555 [Terrilactibacillus sp. S3-3]|nr:hypothetical protein QS257_21555 [Terrilactibacillus sp. S3-3]
MNQTKILVEGAVSVALFICLLLITFYIPFLAIIFVAAPAVDLLYGQTRHSVWSDQFCGKYCSVFYIDRPVLWIVCCLFFNLRICHGLCFKVKKIIILPFF